MPHEFNRIKNNLRENNSKGQVGFEALVAIIILLLMFAFAFNAYIGREIEVGWSEKFLDAKKECYGISSLINRVKANGKNFIERAEFTHNIRVNGDLRSIEVFWDDDSTYCMFSSVNVKNITHARFNVSGEYKVFNDGSNVVFEKI